MWTKQPNLLHRVQVLNLFSLDKGFPDSSVGKEGMCNTLNQGSLPGSGRSPAEGIGYPFRYSQASLVAQLVKNPPTMRETWIRSLGWEDPLMKGKATHSSILAWRIPWTAQYMGLQTVRHDWNDFQFLFLQTSINGVPFYLKKKKKSSQLGR